MIVDNLPFFTVRHSEEYTFESRSEKQNWKKLKKSLGPTWKYYDSKTYPIVTTINKLGYRSKTVYPTDEYYVALGCSNTFGQYLHEEDRYSNIIERKTGIPVINLGICGGSSTCVFTNLIKLLFSKYPNPKAAIIQWPEQNRISLHGEKGIDVVHARIPDQSVFEFFVKDNSLEVMSKFFYDLTHKICNIPIIEFALNDWVADFYGVDEIARVDKARDNRHCGTKTNEAIAKYTLKRLENV